MTSQQIGKNLRKSRIKLGLKQSEVAKKAGINANYYSRIERGEVNPTIEFITKIIRVLKVKSSDIFPF